MKVSKIMLKNGDFVGRVQPPLSDRELVDMFPGTLSGPFFNHLIDSSSAGFTELILTGESRSWDPERQDTKGCLFELNKEAFRW